MEHLEYSSVGNQGVGAFGQMGLRVLTDSSIAGETFIIIEADVDSVFSCDILPYKSGDFESVGDTEFTNFTLEKGRMKYGRFTNIVVTSGQVTAYKG